MAKAIAIIGPYTKAQELPGNVSNIRAGVSEGFLQNGMEVLKYPLHGRPNTPHVCVWGWRPGKNYRQMGHEVLVMERGYIGDRFFYTSLGFNGLNGWASFPEYPDDGGERFRQHGGIIKPWRTDGDYALILGQVPHDASLQGRNMLPWYMDMAREIKRVHNIPVHFRPHPDIKKRGFRQFVDGTIESEGTLEEALSGARFAVCFNSNSAVDSILAGVPCVVGDAGTMAWSVASHSINELRYPEREAWAHALAFTQWSPEEIRTGKALEKICEKIRAHGQLPRPDQV